jgi:hypothetical protein
MHMNITKVVIGSVLVMFATLGGRAANAQGDTPGRAGVGVIRQIVDILVDETGLTPQEIRAQVQDGKTLAEVIQENGGDVSIVTEAALNAATEQINHAVETGRITQERADRMTSNLPDLIERGLNGELGGDRVGRRPLRQASQQILINVTADETGLRHVQILQQLRDGSTLAQIITVNGGSVEETITAAVAAATERINEAVANGNMTQEQADELIAALQDVYTAAINGELGHPRLELMVSFGVIRLASDETGLVPREIVRQLMGGKSLSEVLTENNVDVNAFIDTAVTQARDRLNQAVTNGRITQEQADERLANIRETLTERITQVGV